MKRWAWLAAALAAISLGVAGCGSGGRSSQQPGPIVVTSVHPGPTITNVRSVQTLAAGRAATIVAQAGVSLRLTASKPSVSRTRLSSSYGHPPAHGYYVTFTMTVHNTGSSAIDLGPLNFYVRITGQGDVTSYMGNAPYSGASSALDNTQVDAGQTLQAPLTFDVRSPHGVLAYAPDKSAAVIWRF
jgi:hypothetical protein